uniref:Uncharacterized protein n=1 Tax=Odontella aurita TaxID=265563 RepID=A0A6U6HF22_9STRA|mmetsp:Transcript_47426/g.143575  ORF Transcript_47426/g.143575 Transcript_47426/m.143575 type:complete len:168 (+) Transcript_47426:393-896(+)
MRFMLGLIFLHATTAEHVSAFTQPAHMKRSAASGSVLFMGMKGGQARRQMELAKKMAMAKEQTRKKEGGNDVTEPAEGDKKKTKLSDEDIKRRNDMKRFDDLLNSESAILSEFNGASGYLTKTQQEEAATAGCESKVGMSTALCLTITLHLLLCVSRGNSQRHRSCI